MVFAAHPNISEPGAATKPGVNLSDRYAVNLLSSLEPIDLSDLPRLEVFKRYLLYTRLFRKDGKVWHRLRLGFFPAESEANAMLNSLRGMFPAAWVTKVSRSERKTSVRVAIAPAALSGPENLVESKPPSPEDENRGKATSPQELEGPGDHPRERGSPGMSREVAEVDLSHPYGINLESSLRLIDPAALPRLEVFKNYRLYATRFQKEGRVWHRLRLGFFPTAHEAKSIMATIRDVFPDAWVTKISGRERKKSARLAIVFAGLSGPENPVESQPPLTYPLGRVGSAGPPGEKEKVAAGGEGEAKAGVPDEKPPEKGTTTPPQISEERLGLLMEKAKEAMTKGEYRRAVQYYTKILEYPDHKFRQDAQEFLGLARERNGQPAQARSEYENFLRLYPKGVAADRVRQRLAGLVTAKAKPKAKLRKAKTVEARTDFYGSLSQFYNRYESYTDVGGNVVNQSSLSTDMDFTIRRRSSAYEFSSVMVGGHDYDFLAEGEDSEFSLSQAYVDLFDRRRQISGRVGRQTRSTDGVLGRFDGAVVSYQVSNWLKVNGLSGLPVNSTLLKAYNADKFFYGLSVDLGTFAKHWDFNLYGIDQEVDGITDRRAVGGEVRYFHPTLYFVNFIDYDISYNELNTVMFVGNYMFPDKTTINTVVNYRKSPFLTTTNATIGQGVDLVTDLLVARTEEEVRQLALDRTAISKSFTLGITRPIHKKLQVFADATMSELTGTEASGGVEAMPGTGYEYFYTSQLIGSGLIKDGDTAIVGLRYYESSRSNTISLDLNMRYPVTRAWRINPRVRVDYRRFDRDDLEQLKIRPSFRTDYRWKRRIRLELDGGVDWSPDWLAEQTDTAFDFFLTLGYRLYF